MEKKWVRIQSTRGAWYEVCNDGTILRKWYAYIDKQGKTRGANAKHRKTTKVLRCEEKCPYWDKVANMWRVELTLPNVDTKTSIAVHKLIAICFIEQPDKYTIVRFKDGNPNNYRADNLYWDKCKGNEFFLNDENRGKIKKFDIDYIKYYYILKNHRLFKEYKEYLENRRRLQKLITLFMKGENLQCRLVETGTREKFKTIKHKKVKVDEPYFMIKDPDPEKMEHDVKLLGNAANRPTYRGFIPFRQTSAIMHRWVDYIGGNNYEFMDIPEVYEYVRFKELVWGIKKSFRMTKDGKLFLRVESRTDFDMEDFKEIPEDKGKEIFGEKR